MNRGLNMSIALERIVIDIVKEIIDQNKGNVVCVKTRDVAKKLERRGIKAFRSKAVYRIITKVLIEVFHAKAVKRGRIYKYFIYKRPVKEVI